MCISAQQGCCIYQNMLITNLIVIQRRVIAQSTDGGQFNQTIILGASYWFTVMKPGAWKKEDDQQRRVTHFELSVCTWGSKTHTCPSGAYVEPVMVNSLREQLFPFAWSTMNICNKKTLKSNKISTSRGQNNPLKNMSDDWKHPYSTWPGLTSTTDVNTLYDTHLRVNLSSEGL